MAFELAQQQWEVERQKVLPVVYKGIQLDEGYRIDLLVARKVVVEIKSVNGLLPIHEAQLLTYLKLTGLRVGLLINFNVPRLVDGVKRLING